MIRPPLTAALLSLTVVVPCVAQPVDGHLFIATTDYSVSGSTVAMTLAAPWATTLNVEPVSADPILRYANGRHYVVNRFLADNIQVIDANTFDTRAEFSVGPTTNPHDVAVIDDTHAYVTRYERTHLLLVNPVTGARLDSLDLAPFADADGLPEMSMMARAGNRLFVQLARLDRPGGWGPAGVGALAVIDVSSGTLVDADPAAAGVQPILLAGSNPQGKMIVDGDTNRLYVACAGRLGDLDGGIECVDTDALRSEGWVIRESDVAGDVGAFVLRASACFVLVSDDFFFDTRLLRVDMATRGSPDLLYAANAFLPAIAYDEETDQVFLADRTPSGPGVHVFDASSGTRLTAAPVPTGLPPVDMAIARGGAPLSVAPAPFARVAPNPWRIDTTVSVDVIASGRYSITVFGVDGRPVRTFPAQARVKGTTFQEHWTGRDDRGRRLPSGVYWIRVEGPTGVKAVQAILTR